MDDELPGSLIAICEANETRGGGGIPSLMKAMPTITTAARVAPGPVKPG